MDATIHPGPRTLDLLALQPQHRSEYIWDGQLLTQTFRARRVDLLWDFLSHRVLHPRVVHYLEEMRLYRIIRIGRIQLDWALITALIKRPEDETVASGSSRMQLVPIREHLEQIHHTITDESAEVDVQRYTRLMLLLLLGVVLFPNTSGNLVSLRFLHHIDRFEDTAIYSWGGGVISYLYRQMCRACIGTQRDVGGFLPLLQFQPPLPQLPANVEILHLPLACRFIRSSIFLASKADADLYNLVDLASTYVKMVGGTNTSAHSMDML
ncbi:PREDICTED: serine/threonine-protein phosphatase 7 long form homolog [Nicotiana attenuata]|uniref:serine/threonine-protein phosphatase 7 long form homolog n=1 Tax=Nicotiana attenuata TaxID=49451 RepID=UPI000904C333|nr:PREDICTED: serine/threonine-protein phosphatase 7 long form homolog [Nicotiana attenuata]